MPAPTDLIDRRFGQLLVLAKAPDLVSPSGKSRRTAWLCRCDCGATEVIGDRRLPHYPSHAARRDVATSCTQCRSTRTCIVCGEAFTSHTRRAVCSTACRAAHDRTLHRDFLDRHPGYYRHYRELVRALD